MDTSTGQVPGGTTSAPSAPAPTLEGIQSHLDEIEKRLISLVSRAEDRAERLFGSVKTATETTISQQIDRVKPLPVFTQIVNLKQHISRLEQALGRM